VYGCMMVVSVCTSFGLLQDQHVRTLSFLQEASIPSHLPLLPNIFKTRSENRPQLCAGLLLIQAQACIPGNLLRLARGKVVDGMPQGDITYQARPDRMKEMIDLMLPSAPPHIEDPLCSSPSVSLH